MTDQRVENQPTRELLSWIAEDCGNPDAEGAILSRLEAAEAVVEPTDRLIAEWVVCSRCGTTEDGGGNRWVRLCPKHSEMFEHEIPKAVNELADLRTALEEYREVADE